MIARDAIRLLLVEDNAGDARLIAESLTEAPGVAFELRRADRLSAAFATLAAAEPDVVLLDLGLPDSQGLETLVRLHHRAPRVPMVVLTGLDDEELGTRAVQEGAQDYIVKGTLEPALLARAIRYAVARKRVEEELRKTLDQLERRTAELESFTYSVSHDLKEPLRTIEAFSHFVLEDYASRLDEQGRDYLTRMANASARMKRMIEELLLLSRLGRPPEQPASVSVHAVCSDVVASLQTTITEGGARVDIAGDLPGVRGDRPRVEQIFGNLIGNAIKFNHSPSPLIEVGVAEVRQGNGVFFVRDNGIGIDPQYHEQIFEIFERLHRREDYEGTGAGLAIVKRAAEALGGGVWLTSAPGEGSTFFVELPLWVGAQGEEVAA